MGELRIYKEMTEKECGVISPGVTPIKAGVGFTFDLPWGILGVNHGSLYMDVQTSQDEGLLVSSSPLGFDSTLLDSRVSPPLTNLGVELWTALTLKAAAGGRNQFYLSWNNLGQGNFAIQRPDGVFQNGPLNLGTIGGFSKLRLFFAVPGILVDTPIFACRTVVYHGR